MDVQKPGLAQSRGGARGNDYTEGTVQRELWPGHAQSRPLHCHSSLTCSRGPAVQRHSSTLRAEEVSSEVSEGDCAGVRVGLSSTLLKQNTLIQRTGSQNLSNHCARLK